MSTLAPTPTSRSQTAAPVATRTRVEAIDALRGFVMFLMLAEVMRLWTLHDAFPSSTFWSIVAYNTTHVPWQGCSLHDLIQPAFSFLVGAALPFSIASRRAANLWTDAASRRGAQRHPDAAWHFPQVDGASRRPIGRSKTH